MIIFFKYDHYNLIDSNPYYFETFLNNILAKEFSINVPNHNLEIMQSRFAIERADNFQDLRCVLNTFKISNVEEMVDKYKTERMLKITALMTSIVAPYPYGTRINLTSK